MNSVADSSHRPLRCSWAGNDPDYIAYHDREWGVPVHDDKLLFEFLILEGAQAGLSWITILKRRNGYRRAFCRLRPSHRVNNLTMMLLTVLWRLGHRRGQQHSQGS